MLDRVSVCDETGPSNSKYVDRLDRADGTTTARIEQLNPIDCLKSSPPSGETLGEL